MESSLIFLPYFVLLEILSRCSLKTVDQLKVMSKICNEISSDPIFQLYHKMRTGTVYGYIIQTSYHSNHLFSFVSLENAKLPLDFLPPKSQILASSDHGVLCCVTRDNCCSNPRFYVCKPTTRQVQMLPNPKVRYTTDRVAMAVMQSSDSLRYRIVRLSFIKITTTLCRKYLCEIFDSKLWAWKQLDVALPTLTYIGRKSVFTGRRFHWLLSNNQVLAFDLKIETYTIFSLPTEFMGTQELVKYKGKLGLMCQDLAGDYELWVLEDIKNQGWKKITKINTQGVRKNQPYFDVVDIHTTNTALVKGHVFMFYNFENSSANVVDLDWRLAHPKDIFGFRSDHELVNLRGRN